MTPQLRFPEFTDVWVTKKLGDILDYEQPTKYLVSSTDYDKSYATPVLTAGKSFILGYTNETENVFTDDLPVILFDDFTTARQWVDFPFKVKSSAAKILRPKNGVEPKIAFEVLSRVTYQTKGHQRHWISEFSGIDIAIPGKLEQKKLATFLSIVDRRVHKSEKRLALLRQYRDGVLQKIFTQSARFQNREGTPYPEWKVRVLKEVFSRVVDKNRENNQNILTISAQQGLISQTDFFSKVVAAKDMTTYQLLQSGDFAYNKSYSAGYPMGAIKRLNLYDKGIVSTLYICFRAKNPKDSVFFEQIFDYGLQNVELEKIAQEGARNHGLLNISIADFFNIGLILPTSEEEQEKISILLSVIDRKVLAEESYLESIRAWRRALTQRMFV